MKKIDIRDFMNYHYPTGLTAAPDGKHGAFAVVDVNEKENCYDSCLWIMDLSDGSVRKLTSGRKREEFFLDRRGNASFCQLPGKGV